MALAIYSAVDTEASLSNDGSFTNPFSITFDGRTGGVKQVRLYIRNNDPTFYYENITLHTEDTNPINLVDNTGEGFMWKLSNGDVQPTENEWANIAPANQITVGTGSLGSVGSPDTSTFLPVWVYIQVPPGLDVQSFNTVKLALRADEVVA